jgi:4-diphosphocytidyl-2-C-methyl-D-erythritol kinase
MMGSISLRCPAKINLSLDVIGKREDGYHLLRMIMQSVSLFDVVTIKSGQDNIRVFCENKDVPCNESNIAFKAAKLILEKYKIEDGVHIFIEKNIPIAAGLAGGSTDAAGVIKGINELYKLNLTIQEMMDIGLKIGADVPYCIIGGTALAEGIGEKLTRLEPIKETWCVLAKPPIAVSTVEVYKGLKLDELTEHPETDRIISYIENGDIESIGQNMVNVLETVTIKKYSVISEIKNVMMGFHALGSMMSGSGPTVFGLFADKDTAEKCYNKIREDFKEVYLVKTSNEGVHSL